MAKLRFSSSIFFAGYLDPNYYYIDTCEVVHPQGQKVNECFESDAIVHIRHLLDHCGPPR